MTGAPGFLEFFVLEAGEYIEQLDGLLVGATDTSPDAETLQRLSRALRGSATMAKLPAFAGVAAAMERVGRALREGELRWDFALRAALIAAVDDLKTLLRSARSWTPAEDQRAGARVAELTLYAPPRLSGVFRPPGERSSTQSSTFLASESANIAAGLELLTTRPGDTATAGNVLGRIRALRGVAEVKEVAPLADALEATEDAAHGLDSGTAMTDDTRRVLETAAAYLRQMSPVLRAGNGIDTSTAGRDAFNAAVAGWRKRNADAERIVPIAELFYGDGTPGLVEASQNPPTSARARFRLEMVSLAEHLRGVIDSVQYAADVDARERVRRELARSLRSLRASATSFGELDIASKISEHSAVSDSMDPRALASLDAFAVSLAEARPTPERSTVVAHRPAEPIIEPAPEEAPEVATTTPEPMAAPTPPEPIVAPMPPRQRASSRSSADLIDSTIATLDQLSSAPMLAPTPIPEDEVVPIEALLYRGHAALTRAIEISDALRRGAPTWDADALEELFDLVELARAD